VRSGEFEVLPPRGANFRIRDAWLGSRQVTLSVTERSQAAGKAVSLRRQGLSVVPQGSSTGRPPVTVSTGAQTEGPGNAFPAGRRRPRGVRTEAGAPNIWAHSWVSSPTTSRRV
jgi:hypothetical protein